MLTCSKFLVPLSLFPLFHLFLFLNILHSTSCSGNIISIDDQPSSGLIKFKIADESCPGQSLAVEFFPESEVVDNIIVGGAYRIIGRAAVEPKGVVFQCLGLFQCMDREEREFIRELGRK